MIDPDPKSYATLCYGVTDRSWVNVTEINVTSGVVHWPLERCKTDEDCSLNGKPSMFDCHVQIFRIHVVSNWIWMMS